MRHGFLIAALTTMMPFCAAMAADMPPGAEDWHLCATDADCVVVPGICGESAVNLSVEHEAAAWYRERKKETKCPQIFWKPDTGKARCRLEFCEVAM
jgi:hypothetical protein